MITMAGTIGAGKTLLATKLAEHLGTNAILEPVDSNPILPKFYQNPKQYCFLLQIYLLNKRLELIQKAQAHPNNVLDRSIYEDAVFTNVNYQLGNINKTERKVYESLLNNMMQERPKDSYKKKPDLLVFIDIDIDHQLEHIKARGRAFEQVDHNPKRLDYYKRLQRAYQSWYNSYRESPKMKINGNRYDFVNHPDDMTEVLRQIEYHVVR
ncbi:deoxynucleoside kinase (plasmid) [Nicoliella spurrieriana]|uniref:Deoxynucleoside kinase n=1 Tax=Nicoliella spurrieriana TaxID=2925830 RepID=A0A976X4M5_9LACO|nr:deoxynucleoside kinase [Nicoliella spurrieriana]UQS86083.1 deoxynucleoside kinase [Nicoliella spurrieriana]